MDIGDVHLPHLRVVFGRLLCNVFAIGALISIPVALVEAPFWVQVVVWAICSMLSIWLVRPHLLKALHKGGEDRRSNADALAGQIGEVTEMIPAGGFGRVKLDGDDWKAEAPHLAEPLAVGDKVRILGHESIILKVEKSRSEKFRVNIIHLIV